MNPRPDEARVALALFGVMWAMGAVFHLAKWSLWAKDPAHLALTVAAALVLLRPGDLVALAGLFAAQVSALAADLPITSNHLYLSGLVGVLGLLAMGGLLARPGRRLDPASLMAVFAPPARLSVILVFLLAGFAKLNADWFRPATSCAAGFHAGLAETVPFLPRGDWAVAATMVGAVTIELAAPVLLVSRRTRVAGLLLAFAFLFLVGITGFFNFAAITLALLALFVPADLLTARASRGSVRDRLARLAGSLAMSRIRRLAALVVAGTAALIALARPWAGQAIEPRLLRELGSGRRPTISYAFEAAWWVYAIALLVLFLLLLKTGRPRWPSARELFAHPAPAFAVIPLLVLLIGVAPYLGLRTETAFAMFSNLRTERGSNHFVVRRTADVAGFQRELVQIESSSDPELRRLAERGYLLPMTELRSYVRARALIGDPDFSLTYVHGGRRRAVTSAGRDPALTAPQPLVVRKLIAFRPVWTGSGSPCRH